jgi:hypothetical protein
MARFPELSESDLSSLLEKKDAENTKKRQQKLNCLHASFYKNPNFCAIQYFYVVYVRLNYTFSVDCPCICY